MKKYNVIIPYVVHVTQSVEADSEEDAIELAIEESEISGYCGNGGSNKLIGITGDGCIEACDTPLEIAPFSIECDEVK